MKKNEKGFSIVEALLVLVILGVVGIIGYAVVHKTKSSSVASSAVDNTQTTQPVKTITPGTTSSIDALTSQDISAEAAVDAAHSSSDQTNAKSANGATSNIGGAYNESNL